MVSTPGGQAHQMMRMEISVVLRYDIRCRISSEEDIPISMQGLIIITNNSPSSPSAEVNSFPMVMVRKIGSSRAERSSSSYETSSSGLSEDSSTRSVFEAQELDDAAEPEVLQPGLDGYNEGYNSEEFFQHEMDHTRFAINHVKVNIIIEVEIAQLATEFLLPDSVGLRMPRAGSK
ncbi:hypothetical protein LWI28_016827 [Acer negundo]|uniref:Uncharacterized protein n=1 Tax=Acer negundo TaxID=4023 RepID=A0AAD5NI57_ACENE|nr:hypothetical protein LWI28_016827 [Acer negundo]